MGNTFLPRLDTLVVQVRALEDTLGLPEATLETYQDWRDYYHWLYYQPDPPRYPGPAI